MDATTTPTNLVTRGGMLLAFFGGAVLLLAAGIAGVGLVLVHGAQASVRLVWRVGRRRKVLA